MSSHPDVLRVACNEVALESLKRLRRQQDADRPRLVAAALALPWDEEHMRALVVRPLEAALSDALGAPAAAPPPGPVAPAATIDDIKVRAPAAWGRSGSIAGGEASASSGALLALLCCESP